MLDFIDSEIKIRIPRKYYYAITLSIHEYRGITNFLYARIGAEKNPLHFQLKLARQSIRDLYSYGTHKEIYSLKSFNEFYCLVIFHEIAHLVFGCNNFDTWSEMVKEEDYNAVNRFTIENEQEKANEMAYELLKLFRKVV